MLGLEVNVGPVWWPQSYEVLEYGQLYTGLIGQIVLDDI